MTDITDHDGNGDGQDSNTVADTFRVAVSIAAVAEATRNALAEVNHPSELEVEVEYLPFGGERGVTTQTVDEVLAYEDGMSIYNRGSEVNIHAQGDRAVLDFTQGGPTPGSVVTDFEIRQRD